MQSTLEGCQPKTLAPLQGAFFFLLIRWYRFAQPPANGCNASGVKSQRSLVEHSDLKSRTRETALSLKIGGALNELRHYHVESSSFGTTTESLAPSGGSIPK